MQIYNMDILLVKVNNKKRVFQRLGKDLSGIEPPLWMILTAAYLRQQGFSVSIVDAEAENLSIEETISKVSDIKPLLVSVIVSGTNPSASTINMTGAGEFISRLKKEYSNINIAIGGLHASALPKKTLQEEDADFLFEGEGFYSHEKLLNELKKGITKKNVIKIKGLWQKIDGKIYSNQRDDNVYDLGSLPMPAWDLLHMDKYRAHNWHCFEHLEERTPYAVIYTSLGCPFKCSFCCINAIFGEPGIRYRLPIKVIEEIDFLVKNYNVRNIKILDEIFIMKWKHVEEICDMLISRNYGLNIWVYGRIDTVKKYMLEKMKKAGINWIAYGIEAGSKKVRDGVSKGRFTQQQVREVVKMTHEAGINIVSNFIFGLPDDDIETMKETLSLAKELNCAYANLYCAMAYPGSQLYNNAIKQGFKLPDKWDGYSQFSVNSLPLSTKYLSGAQVLKFRDEAFTNYYNDPRYLNMIKSKFGFKTVEYIKEMCSVKLERKNYENNDKVFISNK